jgi:hypothetical protein
MMRRPTTINAVASTPRTRKREGSRADIGGPMLAGDRALRSAQMAVDDPSVDCYIRAQDAAEEEETSARRAGG